MLANIRYCDKNRKLNRKDFRKFIGSADHFPFTARKKI